MDIAIAGISGRFPKCSNVQEFYEKLLRREDLLSDDDDRWITKAYPEMPSRMGKIPDIDKFDAEAFQVPLSQVESYEVRLRILLEITLEAIVDAGFSPNELEGRRVGVYVGVSGNEMLSNLFHTRFSPDGTDTCNHANSVIANRISFAFDFKGPNMVVDTACSSSSVGLQLAYEFLQREAIDFAIVAGVNILSEPKMTCGLNNLGVLSPDGQCRPFSTDANGYVRSEAAVAALLCPVDRARRVYAEILHVEVNSDGYKEKGITHPSATSQQELYQRTCSGARVNPGHVAYIETHGTGTSVNEISETAAIDAVFCQTGSRRSPLLIGSVKTNMGHSEAASGLCGLAKVILSSCGGVIPGNINYNGDSSHLAPIKDGRVKVLSQNTPWPGDIVGITSMGIGGVNAFALLSFKGISRKIELFPRNLPILIPLCARNWVALNQQITKILAREDRGHDHLMAAMLQTVASNGGIKHHNIRGVATLINSGGDLVFSEGEVRAATKIFLAMGGVKRSYESASGNQLLFDFKAFKDSLKASQDILSKLMPPGRRSCLERTTGAYLPMFSHLIFDTVCDQIAIVDLLFVVGVRIQGSSGYSIGKIASNYAMKRVSREEALRLAATMVDEIDKLDVHEAEGETNTLELLDNMLNVLLDARKMSSSRMHCTEDSVSQHKRAHLLSSLNESERTSWYGFQSAPTGSIVLYFSPDSLPLSALHGDSGSTSGSKEGGLTYLPLWDCAEATNTRLKGERFLESVAELYKAGFNIDFAALYSVSYPVKAGSPPISPLVTWHHEMSWRVPIIRSESQRYGGMIFERSELVAHYTGHVIDGRTVFPAAGYLHVVWRAYARLLGRNYEELGVVFEEVSFEELIVVPEEGRFELRAQVMLDSGRFAVYVDETVTCKGIIRTMMEPSYDIPDLKHKDASFPSTCPNTEEELSSQEFYQLGHVLGFRFSGPFRSVLGIHLEKKVARVEWRKNWTTVIDAMFQVMSLVESMGQILVRALPAKVARLAIDPIGVRRGIGQDMGEVLLGYQQSLRLLQGAGFDLLGMTFSYTKVKAKQDVCLEEVKFCPYIQEEEVTLSDAIQFLLQVALSNTYNNEFSVIENWDQAVGSPLVEGALTDGLLPYQRSVNLTNVLSQPIISSPQPGLSSKSRINIQTKDLNDFLHDDIEVQDSPDVDLWVLTHGSSCPCLALANQRAWFLLIIAADPSSSGLDYLVDRTLVASRKTQNGNLFLLGKRDLREVTQAIEVYNTDYSWVPSLQSSFRGTEGGNSKLVIYANQDPYSGIIGLINCLQAELVLTNRTTCFYRVESDSEEHWDFENPSTCLREQLRKGLLFNVRRRGSWGMFASCLVKREKFKELVPTGAGSDLTLLGTVGAGVGHAEWYQQPPGWVSKWEEEHIDVRFTTVNFKELMLTTGKLPVTDPFHVEVVMNYEFSGTTSKGEKVLVFTMPQLQMTSEGQLSHGYCPLLEKLICRIPYSWSLAEACTTPMPYLTAYYCLFTIANMQRGQSVLIHSGAGGFGMAAIFLALRQGCVVYTTVGNDEKRELLKKRFRTLQDSNISYSRNPQTFKREILHETKGLGVDVAINTLSNEGLTATMGVVKKYGIFIELGKYDLEQNTHLSLRLLRNSVKFIAVDLYDIMKRGGPVRESLLQWFRSEVEAGSIDPLPFTTFTAKEYAEALRPLYSGKNFGRSVIDLGEASARVRQTAAPSEITIRPRTFFDPRKVYIMVGGFSGFALLVLIWMHNRGAKKFVITTKSGRVTGIRRFVVDSLSRLGAEIHIKCLDISMSDEASKLVDFAKEIGNVGGIFNFAVLLRDGLFESQTLGNFAEANGPKGSGTILLDQLTRDRCKDLDHFVVFSSVLSTKGGAGVSTYGFTNSVMEQVVRQRRANGLPGVAICFGAIGSVGILQSVDEDAVVGGTIPQAAISCISTLDAILSRSSLINPVVNSFVTPVKEDVDGVEDKVSRLLVELARMFGFRKLDQVDLQKPLQEIGLDSLLEAEVKAFLRRNEMNGLLQRKLGSVTFQDVNEHLLLVGGNQENYETQLSSALSPIEDVFWFPAAFPPAPVPTQPLVSLKSENSSQSSLFLVHPVDGGMTHLRKLASCLRAQVYGLQCCCSDEIKSVPELADYYLSEMRHITPLTTQVYLCGYSLGSVIALEMALRMQKKGLRVQKVILLDGAPKVVENIIKFIFSRLPANKSASFFLSYINSLNISMTNEEVKAMKAAKYDDQLLLAAATIQRELLQQTQMSMEELKQSLDLMHSLVAIAEYYVPEEVFRGDTVLIRAKHTSDIVGRGLSISYGLEQACSRLRVIDMDAHHDFAFNDAEYAKLAAIINSIID